MSKTEQFNKYIDIACEEGTATSAPSLFAKVKELSEKVGVQMPSLHLHKPEASSDHPLDRAILNHMIAVFPRGKGNGLVVGRKALELFGADNLHAPVSEELSAVMAHELGHLKNKDLGMLKVARHSPAAGIAVAIAATAIVSHHFKKKKKEAAGAAKDTNPEHALPGEEHYTDEQAEKDRKHPLGWAITTAKYLAAAAAGLVAGTYTLKVIQNHAEYSADAFSAKTMGSGEPLARALEKLDGAYKAEKAKAAELLRDHMRDQMVPESMISTLEKISNFYANLTHPSTEKRVERLRSM